MNITQRTKTSPITLAIESAIGKGSLALFHGEELVGLSPGGSDVSRAEHLIPSIDEVLNEAGRKLVDVDRIAVSRGPGSYTGIRVGLATVAGLAAARNVEIVGMSALEALLQSGNSEESNMFAVLKLGGSDLAWQSKVSGEFSDPEIGSVDDLLKAIDGTAPSLICTPEAVEYEALTIAASKISITDEALAFYIGRAAIAGRVTNSSEPLYLLNRRRNPGLF